MFHESEAMLEAIETLIEKDVPSLPVHDSLIVPSSRAELAKKKIEEVFQSRFNVPFVVTKSG